MAVNAIDNDIIYVSGIKYTHTTDDSSDWDSVSNDTYFYDLDTKLPYYKKELGERERVAKSYTNTLTGNLTLPIIKSNRTSVWAQYTVRINNRDKVQKKLQDKGIPTAIYYPVSLHLQECFRYLNYKENDFPVAEEASNCVLSLPMNAFLTDDNISYIIKTLNDI